MCVLTGQQKQIIMQAIESAIEARALRVTESETVQSPDDSAKGSPAETRRHVLDVWQLGCSRTGCILLHAKCRGAIDSSKALRQWFPTTAFLFLNGEIDYCTDSK